MHTFHFRFFLAYLIQSLQRAGVHFEKKRVNLIAHQLQQSQFQSRGAGNNASSGGVKKYAVVINCTGLGAVDTESDSSMFPMRGQVLRLHAPWVKGSVTFGGNYVIPNMGYVACLQNLIITFNDTFEEYIVT
jgi:hypothetical protein